MESKRIATIDSAEILPIPYGKYRANRLNTVHDRLVLLENYQDMWKPAREWIDMFVSN